MKDFHYSNTTKIIFGRNSLSELSALLGPYNNILLVFDEIACKINNLIPQIKKKLPAHNFICINSIKSNPDLNDCEKVINLGKKQNIDFILAVGGGSVIDASKFISASLLSDVKDYWELMEDSELISNVVPLGVICTLPATGSEANSNMVITNQKTHSKVATSSELLFPKFAIMNPEYTLSLPKEQTAFGIVDAFVHVLEQYLTVVDDTPLQDRQSEAVLSTLLECGPKLLEDPTNYQLRATIMWAAQSAHNGVIACGVTEDWATHRIGHVLTAFYGIPHAPTLTIVLPHLLHYTHKDKHEKLLQLGRRVFNIVENDEQDAVSKTIASIMEFTQLMGVTSNIRDFVTDVPTDEIIDLVSEQFSSQSLGEKQNIDGHAVKQIMTNVFIGVTK